MTAHKHEYFLFVSLHNDLFSFWLQILNPPGVFLILTSLNMNECTRQIRQPGESMPPESNVYMFNVYADTEKECKINTMAIGYLGSVNVSNQGAPCLVWADVTTSSYVALLPDVRTTDAHNFCRNILGDQTWDLPSCLTKASDGSIVVQPCDVKFCGEYFVTLYSRKRIWECHPHKRDHSSNICRIFS